MDPLLALIGQTPDDEQQRRIAQALRGQLTTGARLGTSTIGPVAKQGQLMQGQAADMAAGIGRQKYMNESTENQRASILRQALADQREANAPKKYKLSDRAAKDYRESMETYGNIRTLSQRFRDDFAGSIPFAGELENWVANKGVGTGPMKAQAQWWGDWKKFYENVERNRLFGSALTEAEQRQWKASNITPDMDPEQIRERLKVLNRLSQKLAAYEAYDMQLRGHGDYAREMSTSIGVLPEEAFQDLKGFMSGMEDTLQGTAYLRKPPEEMSDEELLRAIEEKRKGGVL